MVSILFQLFLFIIFLTAPILAEKKEINIGVIAPISGEYSEIALEGANWARLAADDYKDRFKVNLIFEDDEFKASKGMSAVNKLLKFDKVDALINSSTPTGNAIYDLLNRVNIPVIQQGIIEHERDDNFFIIQPSPNYAIKKIAKELHEKNEYKNVVFLYFEDPSVVKLIDDFKLSFKKTFIEIPVSQSESDFKTITTKALKNKPDLILFLNSINQTALLMKEFLRQGYKSDVINLFGFSGYEKAYKYILGSFENYKNAKGLKYIESPSSKFKNKYFLRYKENSNFEISAMFYDSVQLLLDTYSDDKLKWINNIANYNKTSALGVIKFDKVGKRICKFAIIQPLNQ